MGKDEGVLVLTPEHVQIRLVPAGMGSRFLAWLIDFIIQAGVVAVLFKVSAELVGATFGGFVFLTGLFVFTWGYHIYFDVRSQGRSPGKRVLGLRVVDERGLPITLQQSFVRNIVRAVDMQPQITLVGSYGFGGLISLFHPESRRLGDIAAGTLVVAETQTLEYPGRVAEGRQYNTLRNPRVMRAIRHRIGLEEREFLLALCLRASKMDDKPRFDLMEDVGDYYREKLRIEDPHLSGENFVRGLTAIIFEKKSD